MPRLNRYIKYLMCLVKLILAFIYVQLNKKRLYSLNIWLIQEKHTEARDNGYHLYKYICTEHPNVNVFYSITKNSSDRKKVTALGRVINADSIKHYIYYLAAKNSIGSQAFGACPYPTDWVRRFHFLCRKDQKVIFLQHGVTKDSLPEFAYEKTHFDLFVCSSIREYQYIHEDLRYPVKKVQMLGLCRFDNLLNRRNPKKQVLIMPTFRSYLVATNREQDATKEECEVFMQSNYYLFYYNLLTDKRFLEALRSNGFCAVFYMHYSMQAYTKVFNECNNDVIIIAGRKEYDVQDLMIESAILLTDFSSVFFDFAYMKKPELFCQFDEDEYRENHYAKGYFDYRNDGFGPVFTDREETVNYIINEIKNDCTMEQLYVERVDSFFAFRDNENCKRNYEAIQRLSAGRA